jgi:NAD(P)-dependent dehydrogenase (short-subunit alcohol dehydrogenase family)
MSEGRLAGKRAVIVGAGQSPGDTEGNGRAISRIFSEQGATLLLVDRKGDAARGTAAVCSGKTHILEADVLDPGAGAAVADKASALLGGIDILIYNVGVGDRHDGPSDKMTDEAWDRIMGVNLTGARRCFGACLPVMRESGKGAIVAISSLAAIAPSAMFAYSVSKAGLCRLVESTAFHEAANGVRCNAILPGLMETPMAIEGQSARMGIDKEVLIAHRSKAVPMGHMGTAEDTAMAALFLASDEARFITGVLLPVDGGSSVKVA